MSIDDVTPEGQPSDAPPSPESTEPAAVIDIAAKAIARDAVAGAIAAGKLHRDSPFDAVRFQVVADVPVWILRGAWEEARDAIPRPTRTAQAPPEEWGGEGQPEDWDQHGNPDASTLPTIQIRAGGGEITRMVQETIKALGEHDPNLYWRGWQLVRIIREPDRKEPYEIDERAGSRILTRPGTPQLSDAAPTLLEHVDACSQWERFDCRAGEKPPGKGSKAPGEWVAANPDPAVIKLLQGRKEYPGIRPIKGIIETPCLAPSGRIIMAPGYDEETQHVLLPSVNVGPIADAPTQKQAMAALKYLWIEMACDFPFKGVGEPARNSLGEDIDPDREMQYQLAIRSPDAFVGVAMLATAFARLAIAGAVPGGMFEAAARGSGKSLQVRTIAMVTTSRDASMANFPMRDGRPNEEELEKMLMGYALQGARLICLDNLKGVITSATLERAMTTAGNIEGRVLGLTGQRSLPWSAILLFSGNNMTMSDDMADRVLMSRIESPREEPRKRPANTFRHPDLVAAIAGQRTKMIRAVLVVLRSYVAAKTAGLKGVEELTRGSFEPWARLIPGAILWAGGPDILAAFPEGGSGGDDESEAHAVLLRYWREDWQGQKVAYIHEAIFKGEHDKDIEKDPQLMELRASLRSLTRTREGSPVSSHVMAMKFFGLRGKIRDGLKLQDSKDRSTKVTTYRVVDTRPAARA